MSEHPEPEELEAPSSADEEVPLSADEEDALYEEVLDLYSREGLDGVLAGPPELRNVAGCRALVNLGRGIHLSDPDQSAACVVCADLLASRLRPGELGERELQDFRCEMALQLVCSWIGLKRTALARGGARAGRRVLPARHPRQNS